MRRPAKCPLPYRVDDPGGSSPTGGWGILRPEDLPNPLTFLLDVFFYGLALWLAGYVLQVQRGKVTLERLAILLPLGLIWPSWPSATCSTSPSWAGDAGRWHTGKTHIGIFSRKLLL